MFVTFTPNYYLEVFTVTINTEKELAPAHSPPYLEGQSRYQRTNKHLPSVATLMAQRNNKKS